MEFKDKIVVVTGGTRGIGRAISLRFAREGAQVFAAYLKNDAAAEALAREAAGLPGAVHPLKCDVSRQEGAVSLVEEAARGTGRIDVLVNNAGIIRDGYLAMMSDDDWEAVIHGNLSPLFHCCKWGARKMIGNRSGAIVNLSSVSAITGTAGQTNYAASKGAAISFTKALARELGPMGIRVNTVAPGLIDTEMLKGMKQQFIDNIVKSTAMGRIGRPDEVADAVAFLASERASYITGHCLVIDGGLI
ncbi:MAG TPA: 3-oxoacyl-ACP reductase FabG [Geobacteraceae bacterium]